MGKTILIVADYYLPGYLAGGPIRSISNMVDWLGDSYDFKIITSHTDYTKKEPYPNVEINGWNTVGKAEVFYFDGKISSYNLIWKAVSKLETDLVLFNSFFSPKFTILPFIIFRLQKVINRSQCVIISRGEFSADALRIKGKKKSIYLSLVKKTGLFNDIHWCFTNDKEKTEFFENINIPYESVNILPNLPKKLDQEVTAGVEKKENCIRIIYLSRIASIKNIDYALEMLAMIKEIEIEFDIYGIKDDPDYWQKCKKIIKTLPDNITVNYKGPVENDKVIQIIAEYHLFLLPTKSENFGHAIYEAMIAGTPVLISDRTPWRNLEEKNLGWDLSLDNMQNFIPPIKEIAAMNQKEITDSKRMVRANIQKEQIQKSVKKNKQVLNKLMN